MYEGAAKEITDADFNAALQFGQEVDPTDDRAQKELLPRKRQKSARITLNIVPDEILNEAKSLAGDRIVPPCSRRQKLAREAAVKAIPDEVGAKLVGKIRRRQSHRIRAQGRLLLHPEGSRARSHLITANASMDAVSRRFAPSTAKLACCPRAMVRRCSSRGETQAVTLCTLGTGEDAQEFDSYTGGETKRSSFCITTSRTFPSAKPAASADQAAAKSATAPLPERSIEPMLPLDTYPYAIRITSEIMESNGSTSMASVCGGTSCAHGCRRSHDPPVAGISVGICTEYGDEQKILRLQAAHRHHRLGRRLLRHGLQDGRHRNGHHGFQLDLKLRGIPHSLMTERSKKPASRAVRSCRDGQDLATRARNSASIAPRIETLKINPEKIGALIGPAARTSRSSSRIGLRDQHRRRWHSQHLSRSRGRDEDRRGRDRGMTAEARLERSTRQGGHDQGIRRLRGIPARQGRPGAHQRTGQLPRQTNRGHRQDRR
jgi:polyribonucleotide nucleotidyltransferase